MYICCEHAHAATTRSIPCCTNNSRIFQCSHYAADRQLLGGKTNWSIQSLIPCISFYLGCSYNVTIKNKTKNLIL